MSRPEKLRIGVISHGISTQGGIESVVYHLCRQYLRLGHSVTLYSAQGPEQPLPGLRHVLVRVPRRPWVLRQMAFAWASARAVRRDPAPLLQAHVNTFAPAQVMVCHSVHAIGTEVVLALDPKLWRRAWQRVKTLAPLVNWLAGYNYRSSALRRAVATSNGIGRELLGLYPQLQGKLGLVPNGFDPAFRHPATAAQRARLRKRLGLKSGQKALLFIGKEFHRKGLEPILRSLPLLPASVQLWVIGQNVDVIPASHFEGLVDELGLRDRVRFWGHQRDLLGFYQAADALVFPTLYEAFAMVSIEALACGLPLLATQANGTEDLIVEGRNGAFVTRDGVSIAKAVRRWVLPEARRKALSRGALRTAKDYSWDKIAKRHLNICLAASKERV